MWNGDGLIDSVPSLGENCLLTEDTLRETVNNLEDYEKVSLVFLLFEPSLAVLELANWFRPTRSFLVTPNSLMKWKSDCGPRWKETLVEALLIIQAFSDVNRLGIDVAQVKNQFAPHSLETSVFIHPVKKVLYHVCENLLIKDVKDFINRTQKEVKHLSIGGDDFTYLEFYLLKMIHDKTIKLGSWVPLRKNPAETEEPCDLSVLIDMLGTHPISKKLIAHQQNFNARSYHSDSTKLTPYVRSTPSGGRSAGGFYHISDRSNMGNFIIFNHRMFPDHPERHGTEKDVAKLKACWTALGFRVEVRNDVPANQVTNMISNYSLVVKREHSAFAVCILSHGFKGHVYGSDGKSQSTEDIERAMLSPESAGKPKLLIIQACRGQSRMRTFPLEGLERDDDEPRTEAKAEVPREADLLVFWSTVENYYSYRDPERGTPFIQILCDRLTDLEQETSALDIFTEVNNRVAEENIQVCQFKSTWTKTLMLKKIQ